MTEGHINHGTAGRINVERGDNSVTLRLWQWSLKPDATLSFDEAKLLMRKITEAMTPAKVKASAPVVEDDYDDIA